MYVKVIIHALDDYYLSACSLPRACPRPFYASSATLTHTTLAIQTPNLLWSATETNTNSRRLKLSILSPDGDIITDTAPPTSIPPWLPLYGLTMVPLSRFSALWPWAHDWESFFKRTGVRNKIEAGRTAVRGSPHVICDESRRVLRCLMA